MRLADTDVDLADFTRWNRAGLDRITYTAEAGAEFVEYLRLAHLLLWSDADPASVPPIEDWRKGYATGTLPDATPLAAALASLRSRFSRQEMDGDTGTGASYPERLLAQYVAPLTDPTAQISRAFARSLHVLSETLGAYAGEGLLRTATQAPHLAALLSYIGYRPRLAASATMPMALMLKPEAGRLELAAGLSVEHALPAGKGILTFESLGPLVAHPALNALRLAGWDQGADPIMVITTVFMLANADAFGRPLVGTTAILVDGTSMEAARITAASRESRTLTLARGTPRLSGNWQTTRVLTAPRLTLPLRPRGVDWVNFAEPQALSIGEVLAVGGNANALTQVRVVELRGRDVRVAEVNGQARTTVARVAYRTRLRFTFGSAPANGGPLPVTSTSHETGDQLGAVVLLSANNVYVEGAAAKTLVVGTPAALRSANGTGRALNIPTLVADGDGVILVVGSDAANFATLEASFVTSSPLDVDPRSRESVTNSAGLVTLLAGANLAEYLVAGRELLLATDPEAQPDPALRIAVYAPIAWVESRSPTETVVSLDLPAASLAGMTRGATLVHANALTFGHGKTLPPRVLGSGDAGNPAPVMHIAEEPVSTRANAAFPGGISPDIEIEVDGRTWALQSPDTPPPKPGEDLPGYTVLQGEDRGLDVVFNRRLPTGTDNIRLKKIRQGAGLHGNEVPPFAIANLKPKQPMVAGLVQPLAPRGGADLERVEQLRRTGGSTFALMNRALAVEDFARLAETHAGVWHASARLGRGAGRGGVWLTIVPAGGTGLDLVVPDLSDLLAARSMPGLALTILPFTPAPVSLSAEVRLRSGYAVQDEIVPALKASLMEHFGLQAHGLGKVLYASQIVALIEAHPAVDNVSVSLTPLWVAPVAPQLEFSNAHEIEAIRPDAVTATFFENEADIALALRASTTGGTS